MALDFAAGCLGGCAGVMVGYPLDTIKVHIQTQDFRNPKYTGTWHCFRTILARESVTGLYRGMSSPMAGVAVVNAIVFGVYGNTQRQLTQPDALYSHFIAGASAGLAQSPVCSPMELAKTRLQLQSSGGTQFSGPVQCLRYIYRNEGYRGVFKGLGITLMREAPGYGTYFMTYEALTRSNSSTPISTFKMLMAGGLAGTVSWIVTYPVDVVKSRLQADAGNRYSGALDCLRQSIRTEGYACLFRGLNSTIIRAFPTNAATFAVVTWTFRLLGDAPADAPRAETKPVVVLQPAGTNQSDDNFLSRWTTVVTNFWTQGLYSKSYSTLSAVGFDGPVIGTRSLSSAYESVELEKRIGEDKKESVVLEELPVVDESMGDDGIESSANNEESLKASVEDGIEEPVETERKNRRG